MHLYSFSFVPVVDWTKIHTVGELYEEVLGRHAINGCVLSQGGKFLLAGDRVDSGAGDIDVLIDSDDFAIGQGGVVKQTLYRTWTDFGRSNDWVCHEHAGHLRDWAREALNMNSELWKICESYVSCADKLAAMYVWGWKS